MIKLIAVGLFLIVGFTFAMSLFQNRIIFPTHMVAPAGPLPTGSERLKITTPDGHSLHGVHIPPARATRERTLIFGFAGNAWNSADAASYLHQLFPQAHVVAFHYRGYAPSTGSPSAEALIADAPLVFEAAVQHVQPQYRIVVGFSIGSGVAGTVAKHTGVDGLILVTPFDSLKAVAREHYPWAPVGLLFREEMDAARVLATANVPVAIIAASEDNLIPPARTEALRRRVHNLIFDRTIAGAGHNDLYHRPDFHKAMKNALQAILAR